MSSCTRCGSAVSGNFCTSCGSPVSSTPVPASPQTDPLTGRPKRSSKPAFIAIALVCLAALIIWLADGGSSSRAGSRQAGIADTYIRAVANGDVRRALTLSPSADSQGVNGARLGSMMMQAGIDWRLSYGPFRDVEVGDVLDHGSETAVVARVSFANDQKVVTLHLVKEGDDWKVRPLGNY